MIGNGGSFFRDMPPVTKNLIIINFIVWLAMMLLPKYGDILVEYGGLHYIGASDFNIAQLILYMFMHSTQGIAHLFFNMFTLFMFGITLERVLGGKRFLFYYLSCGIGAAVIQEGVWALMIDSFVNHRTEMYHPLQLAQIRDVVENSLVTIGASGAIYGVLLAFGMIFPNRPLYLMFVPIPIKAKWMVIGYGLIELALGMASANDGVAHFAHLGGMIFGFFILLYWKHKGIVGRDRFY